jgi:hypothetical protein
MRVLAVEQQRGKKKLILPCCIIIKFEEWDGEEFHVFRNSKNFCGVRKHVGLPRGAKDQGRTALWHLHKEELLAFFRFGNMGRHKWILRAREGERAFDGKRRGS